MSDNEKMDLIDNVWRPESDFNFPETILKDGRQTSCINQWLKTYSWCAKALPIEQSWQQTVVDIILSLY